MSITTGAPLGIASAGPSPLACTRCRKAHLKCDANQPTCSRCSSTGSQCIYLVSQRGRSGPAKRKRKICVQAPGKAQSPTQQADALDQIFTQTSIIPVEHDTLAYDKRYSLPTCDSLSTSLPISGEGFITQTLQQVTSKPTLSVGASGFEDWVDDFQLIELYYANFHSAHPLLVPRAWYLDQLYPRHLRLVMQLIGSYFSTTAFDDSLRIIAERSLEENNVDSSSMVQALLIFSIALHSQNQAVEAERKLAQASCMALELGMNDGNFSLENGRQQPVIEESLRRTWWELFTTDAYMAAFQRRAGFGTSQVRISVPLPCEESAYANASCLTYLSPTLDDFDNRLFSDNDVHFSSFCYRIEACRILSRALAIAEAERVPDDHVQAVDNALASWIHHVPPTKDVVSEFGLIDEMLFQAHMIIQCANIFLHFPRSNLFSSLPEGTAIICARGGKQLLSAETQLIHASKATNASKALSNLAALRSPVQKHTPFFLCSLGLSAVVQLSASYIHGRSCMEQHRDRVTLIVGILKSLSQHWKIASGVLQQIKKLAAEVLQVSARPTGSSDSQSLGENAVNISANGNDTFWDEFMVSQELGDFNTFGPHCDTTR